MCKQDAERIESAKAGAVAAVGGLLGSLPYLATAGHGVSSAALSAAQIFASCLLFGVTFRYVLAADKDNIQLKSGAVAAFGMVRLFPPTCIRIHPARCAIHCMPASKSVRYLHFGCATTSKMLVAVSSCGLCYHECPYHCSPRCQVWARCFTSQTTAIKICRAKLCWAWTKLRVHMLTGLSLHLQVRGLAYSDALQSSAASSGGPALSVSVVGASALAAGESLLTFGFAAAAVEAAIRAGVVKPFGSATSA